MMGKRLPVSIFAILGAIVILSLAFVQPVTARESGQVEILEKYDQYITIMEQLGEKISSDSSLKSLADHQERVIEDMKVLGEKLSSDSELKSLVESLSKDDRIVDLFDELKNAKSEKEVKLILQRLKEIDEYKQIESIIKSRYSEDIEKMKSLAKQIQTDFEKMENIVKSKYSQEIKTLEPLVKDLQNNPDEMKGLLNAMLDKYTRKLNINGMGDLYAIKVNPPSRGQQSNGHLVASNQVGGCSPVRVEGTGDGCHGLSARPSGSVRVSHSSGKHGGGSSAAAESAHASVKYDLNGNVYVWVPGYGWYFIPHDIWEELKTKFDGNIVELILFISLLVAWSAWSGIYIGSSLLYLILSSPYWLPILSMACIVKLWMETGYPVFMGLFLILLGLTIADFFTFVWLALPFLGLSGISIFFVYLYRGALNSDFFEDFHTPDIVNNFEPILPLWLWIMILSAIMSSGS